jgi:hypothetical protein
MGEPVAEVLRRHGINCRLRHKGGVTWHNLEVCPLCRHPKNFQCGISESVGRDGRLYHGVKCFHVADNGTGTDTPPYEEFLFRLGELSADGYDRIRCFRGAPRLPGPTKEHARPTPPDKEVLRPLNPDFHGKLRRRLRENNAAQAYLAGRGLAEEAVSYFGLGLSTPYVSRRNKLEHSDALVYPMMGRDGRLYNKYGYYNIPGVTRNPISENGWMTGDVRTYYSADAAGKKSVFVCEGAKDLWRTWQALRGSALAAEMLLVTSTHGSAFPEEWKDLGFWAGWADIYLGQDNDEAGEFAARKLSEMTGRETRRAAVPREFGKDWTDFWQGNGGDVREFEELLRSAPFACAGLSRQDDDAVGPGRYAYQPVSINGAYHNGHLYYTARVLNRSVDLGRKESGEEVVRQVERLETVVIKSDRTVHSAIAAPAPKGTGTEDRVLRLTDGTLIDRPPTPNKYGTWSWPSINNYLEGRSATRPLGEILRDVTAYLEASVWLPHEEDYAILTLTVPVTYAQRVFDSVPLVFLNGPAGSGKSEMGRAMARVCSNAYVCGQSSAASIARFVDESRGFVVLDDLEVIGNKGGEFGELVQALKLSYNKTTAVKLWTDVKTMRTQLLDFYGVKMINNTQGADGILGSRMLRIQTRKIPDALRGRFADLAPADARTLHALRDELHTWTFENVSAVAERYRSARPKGTDRDDEITAPLKVMASLADDRRLRARLEIALLRQRQKAVDLDDPVEILKEALRHLIAQGYVMISITHLVLEMRDLISQDYGKSFTNEIAEWARPEWVGRMLRREDLIETDPALSRRIRVWGANLRFYPIARDHIEGVRVTYAAEGVEIGVGTKRPQDFCQTCDVCPYRALDCEIMARRQADERLSRTIR